MLHVFGVYRLLRLFSPSIWRALWRGVPNLFEAISHFEQAEYEAALQAFDGVLNCLPEPTADYLAFHAYLLLLNGSPDTLGAWQQVVDLAQRDSSRRSRYAAAVGRYYLATLAGSREAFQHWREAHDLQPTRGVAAYIRIPDVAEVT